MTAQVLEESEQTLVGASVPRTDSVAKVSGRAIYTRDMRLPNMLYGKIKRCPFPHARIVGMDFSDARAIKGVRTIITSRDFPDVTTPDTPALAEEVLYSNQGVVAVACDDKITAERAIASISVDYEQLPAVFDPEVAMSGESPVTISHPGETTVGPNIAKHLKLRVGDTEEAFSRSEHIFENTFRTAAETHFQLEPLSFLARPDSDGGVTVWATSSGPHKIQLELARYLGMDPYTIRVEVPYLGGWFGSKEESHLAAVCAMLALKSSRPVKLDLSREETITASGVRHPSIIRVKDGVMNDGAIVSRQIEAVFDGGAYGTLGTAIINNVLSAAVAIYKIPNMKMDVYRVYTNRVPGVAKRAPIATQVTWAIESQMDYNASVLRLDPVGLRLKNILHKGEKNAIGEKMESIDHEKCLTAVAEAIRTAGQSNPASSKTGAWRRGTAVAIGAKASPASNTPHPFQASIRVRETGKVEVWAVLVENGQGIHTTIAQLVATEFGIDLKDVIIMAAVNGSESSWGLTMGAAASRQLVNVGKAVQLACDQVKEKILDAASAKIGTSKDDLVVKQGKIIVKSHPERSIKISDLFSRVRFFSSTAAFVKDFEFVGTGSVVNQGGRMDPDTGVLVEGRSSSFYVAAAQGITLAVNVETGAIKIERIVASMDVGKAVNPEIVKAQIIGSVAMGVNAAISEELVFSEGTVTNANLADYKLLSCVDSPTVEPIIVEVPYEEGPYGAKAAGEASIVPTAPAIRAAIHDAVGVWIDDLPITPEKVLNALAKSAR